MAAAIAVSMGQDVSADVKEDVNLAEEAVSCSNSDKSEAWAKFAHKTHIVKNKRIVILLFSK